MVAAKCAGEACRARAMRRQKRGRERFQPLSQCFVRSDLPRRCRQRRFKLVDLSDQTLHASQAILKSR